MLVKWYADRLDRVDEIYLYWVVSIAELAGAAWDHSLHMTLGKIPQFIDGELVHVEGGPGKQRNNSLYPLAPVMSVTWAIPSPSLFPNTSKGSKM